MPLYEYQCKLCGHRFEKIQSFSAEPLKECPVCQGEVERLISASALQFKGSGFYSNDYAPKRSGGASAPPAASGSKESSSGESSTPKSETTAKPETRSDAASKTAGTTT